MDAAKTSGGSLVSARTRLLCGVLISIASLSVSPARAAPAQAEDLGAPSKFETKHIRHKCIDRGAKKGLSGAEAESFVEKCVERRIAQRGPRQECKKQALSQGQGGDRKAMRAFVRACVAERMGGGDKKAKP